MQSNLEDSIDSSNFFIRDYLPLIPKDSMTYLNDLAVSVNEGGLFAGLVSRKR